MDTAPLLPVADTRILASKADVLVFLARWRKTPQDAIESAFRLLDNTGAHLAGVGIADGALAALRRRVELFGFHLATLDVRVHARDLVDPDPRIRELFSSLPRLRGPALSR